MNKKKIYNMFKFIGRQLVKNQPVQLGNNPSANLIQGIINSTKILKPVKSTTTLEPLLATPATSKTKEANNSITQKKYMFCIIINNNKE